MEKIDEIKVTARELLENLIGRTVSIYDDYNREDGDANDRLLFFFDDLSALAEGIDAICSTTGADADLNELRQKLGMLKDAIDNDDRFLVADILKFELKPLLEYWHQTI